MSSRYHREPVLLFTLLGLPLHGSPLYVAPIRQRKAGPHPSEEGRGSQPWFHIEEREEREAEAVVVVGDERSGNRSGVTLCDMRWTMSTLSLNCFVLGGDSSEVFTVEILKTKNISILKDLSKEKQSPRLNHVVASELIDQRSPHFVS